MVFLEYFRFPDSKTEDDFVTEYTSPPKPTPDYYTQNFYPFYVLSNREFYCMNFAPITILSGGNGSGKSTVLNIIARKLHISRNSPYNTSKWFDGYVECCSFQTCKFYSGEEFDLVGQRSQEYDIASISKMLTSDDIFNMLHDDRVRNDQRLFKSSVLQTQVRLSKRLENQRAEEYRERLKHIDFETGENVKEFRDYVERRNYLFSKYATKHLGELERGCSNGENSLLKLTDLIQVEGLYLLDEPENSLSCEFQIKLKQIIEHASKHCNAQFIIATHSPFLLSLENAKIYSLDDIPVTLKNWWELDSTGMYFELFETNRDKFIKK